MEESKLYTARVRVVEAMEGLPVADGQQATFGISIVGSAVPEHFIIEVYLPSTRGFTPLTLVIVQVLRELQFEVCHGAGQSCCRCVPGGDARSGD